MFLRSWALLCVPSLQWGELGQFVYTLNLTLPACEQAIKDFTRVIELDPDLVIAFYIRRGAYAFVGAPEAAIQDLDTYLELAPDAWDRAKVENFIEQLKSQQ